MNAPAPAGAEVGVYVDLIATVAIGDVVETRTGRRYGVLSVRVQVGGKNAGRQHLRCVVLEEDAPASGRTHRIRWYRRHGGSAAAGIVMR